MRDNQNNSVQWKNHWTFIMAATGSAVGLGNIWKFPYITGEYGGGAFVLVYLACILLVGIPIMMAETLLGRSGRTDPIDSMLKNAQQSNRSKLWSVVGYMGVLSGLMIMMFYSVVAGWVIDYFVQSVTGSYTDADVETINNNFTKLVTNDSRELLWHTLFTVVTATVVAAGVVKGIGRAVVVLMPVLFVLMLIMLGYSAVEGDFASGWRFMFSADFSKLSGDAVLEALGHAFFTLSLGMGAIMAYGAYMPSSASIGKTVLAIGFLDTLIALVAGLVIFPLVFANDMISAQSVGLMFKTLPIAFSHMPGGQIFGSIFFALVTIAALSSSISLIEPGVAWMEKKGISRVKAAIGLALVAWVGGILCLYDGATFDFLDDLTTKVTLPLGGLLIAVFVGWLMPQTAVKTELKILSPQRYIVWLWILRVISPLGVIIVFANSLDLL
ncbi:MAG: sodium-dependent transporter [Pseudomonadales bacterium]